MGSNPGLLLTTQQFSLLDDLVDVFRENWLFLGFPVMDEVIDGRGISPDKVTFVHDLKVLIASRRPDEFCKGCGENMGKRVEVES